MYIQNLLLTMWVVVIPHIYTVNDFLNSLIIMLNKQSSHRQTRINRIHTPHTCNDSHSITIEQMIFCHLVFMCSYHVFPFLLLNFHLFHRFYYIYDFTIKLLYDDNNTHTQTLYLQRVREREHQQLSIADIKHVC